MTCCQQNLDVEILSFRDPTRAIREAKSKRIFYRECIVVMTRMISMEEAQRRSDPKLK
jgi:hypothetical protein